MTESRDQVFPDPSGSSRNRRIVLEFESFRDFIQAFSPVVSEEGMFVTADQLPSGLPAAGEELDFEVRLTDDFRLVHGRGNVVWVREVDDSEGSAGVAVRFMDLDEPSRRLVSRLLTNYTKDGGRPFDLEAGMPLAADLTVEPEPLGRTEADELFLAASESLEPEPELLDSLDPSSLADDAPAVEVPTDDQELPSLSSLEAEIDGVDVDSELESLPAVDVPGPEPLEIDSPPIELDVPEIDLPEISLPESDLPTLEMPVADLSAFDVPEAPELEVLEAPEVTEPEAVIPEPIEPRTLKPVISEEIAQVADELSGIHHPQPVETPSEEDSVHLAGSGRASDDVPAWRTPLFASLAGIAVAVAVWYFAGDRIKGLIGLGEGGERGGAVTTQESVVEQVPAAPDLSPSDVGIAGEEEGSPEAGAVAAREGAEGTATAGSQLGGLADKSVGASMSRADDVPISRVERITWDITDDETVVSIVLDGAVDDSSYEVVRIRQGSPREVIKIFGASTLATPSQLEVNSNHVVRLRSGVHATDTASEVHIVADLTGAAVAVTLVRVENRTIFITFS